MEVQQVILIGGNGFLGTAFKRFLQSKGYRVIVIGRSTTVSGPDYHPISGLDLSKPETFLDTSVPYTIFDFAYTSIPNTSFENPVRDFSENLLNVIQYLEFSKRIHTKKYIYISSGGTVYGNNGTTAFTEEAANFPIAPYGITKLACERYVHMYSEVHGIAGVIARPANIYGPGQQPFRGQGLVATVMASIYQQKPVIVYGNGSTVRDYLYIDDMNTALLDLMNYGSSGEIYNIGSGNGTTIEQIFARIEKVTAPDGIIAKNRLPARPFDALFNVLDYTKLNRLNNWAPATGLEAGLHHTNQWMKQHLLQAHS